MNAKHLRSYATLGMLLGLLSVLWTMGACASGPDVCTRDHITGSERCQPASGDYGEAAATAATAAVAWTAVGCSVNGCEPPFRCNGDTKMCERIPCGESLGGCPPTYVCDPDDDLCK